ncbi:STAS domain-containing protein [Streptomyces sp. NPDC013457]|uniref:STAS domain-containing protein n=1 Tax=Streptomyces sp. NPDC013457 TaxID=3364866 RepID=UPI0036FC9914
MSALKITVRESTVGLVLEIKGELDYASADEVREVLPTLTLSAGQRLVIDLDGMEFCDSSGITALIAARNRAEAAQADIALASVPANTLRILRLVGLDQVFAFHPDAETALRG